MAEAITDFLATAEVMDTSGTRHRGLLAGADLAAWRASAEPPVTLDFRGFTVCKTGPWGQGPVFLQQLALLDGFDLEQMGPGSAEFIHTVTECAKLAFADREAWYGDPRQTDVPLAGLLSASYAAQRRALVGEQAAAGLVPGAPAGEPGRLPGYALAAFGPDGAANGHARGAGAGRRRADRGAGRATSPRPSSAPATPATSTSPTGSATSSPPPPAAAGCRARRSCPASASASAPGARCSA